MDFQDCLEVELPWLSDESWKVGPLSEQIPHRVSLVGRVPKVGVTPSQ